MNLNPTRLAFVLSLAFFLLPGKTALAKTEHVRIRGAEYLPLSAWTRENHFSLRWLKRDETLLLTNRTAKLRFIVDSREAWINDVRVWLLSPLIAREGEVLIAQRDVDATLRPVLFPQKNRSGAKLKTICLDPGHGGKDPGNRVGSQKEKQFTRLLAFELRDQLQKAGFKISLTRSTDSFIELPNRPDIARRRGADLFVSLHFNATESGRNDARGAEVYALTPAGASSTAAAGEGAGGGRFAGNRYDEKNFLLAYQIQKSLVQKLSVTDRGVRRARFAVLRDAAMPAVLIEGGFMTHPVEGKKIFDAAYRREMARAIVNGILNYKRLVES